MTRNASLKRNTRETQIEVALNLDGRGDAQLDTGIGFFDHMLHQLARHSLIDLTLSAQGDRHIDDHHTVEDCGIAIGQALDRALGERRGIRRYASCHLAMDETLVLVALDVSGRAFLRWDVAFSTPKIGTFDTELVREFFQALTANANLTLHAQVLAGANNHHIAEATFKAAARALGDAIAIDPRQADAIPSTKGKL
ncbi:MAG: imidazoleglycerol-phosphate dehydratase HisB [Pseudomonadota bacterium]